jgi:16S rRNA (adenine1518-N6/adenine1519-N6)-dimethyltransferase
LITPRKRLGQHFLRDPNTVRNIISALGAPSGAPVVEIGPGMGALTGLLLDSYPDLIALEVDPRAVAVLQAQYPSLDVREADVLDVAWSIFAKEAVAPLYVIGNLPYYITTPILFSLLDAYTHLQRAVVMMQLEVAQRLVAQPRTKAYGILSVLTQLYAEPRLCFKVSRNVFYPKPDVESAIVGLDFRRHPGLSADADVEQIRQVVRTAFNQRRKTLRNSLKSWVERTQRPVPEAWASRRAEELTPPEFAELAQYFSIET